MTVATDLLAVIAKLSSAERELLDLRLGSKWRGYLAAPSALSNIQLTELLCTLRRVAPPALDGLLENVTAAAWEFPTSPTGGQEFVITNTTPCSFTVEEVAGLDTLVIAGETTATFVYNSETAKWIVLFSTCITPIAPDDILEFGVITQGPAATPYTVPADTVEYVILGTDPCGNSVRRIVTTTYVGRSTGLDYYLDTHIVWTYDILTA